MRGAMLLIRNIGRLIASGQRARYVETASARPIENALLMSD